MAEEYIRKYFDYLSGSYIFGADYQTSGFVRLINNVRQLKGLPNLKELPEHFSETAYGKKFFDYKKADFTKYLNFEA